MEHSPFSRDRSAAMAKGSVAESLAASSTYQTYERAFTTVTGMPMALREPGSWQLPFRGKPGENSFCALLAKRNGSCAACLRLQEQLGKAAAHDACTLTCPFGLSETAVPVRNGNELVALLQTGQVFRKKPDAAQFRRVQRKLREVGVGEIPGLEEAFFATPVMAPKRYEGVVQLLSVFARQLSAASNELLIEQANAEPPVVTRAKEYIREHTSEELSLGQVARAVNTSASYFCRLFKKATGINYSQYLSRVRLEKAKQLLVNRNLRVSEVAFQVGFQSLTHFNRVFKKLLGQSPTEYRDHLSLA